jgi:two-component system NtrC family sensor kinase
LKPEQNGVRQTLRDLIARLAPQTADPDHFASRWLAAACGKQSGIRDEVQLLHPVPRVLERTTRPVLDAQGGPLGRVEIYRDLTAQRTFHSKAIQTERLAALGQMVTSIAHELSNPLTSILGYAQRLLRNAAGGQWSEAQQIVAEAERASMILKQLLLTAREPRSERRKVALNQVVLRGVELQRSSVDFQSTRIELDLDPALPPVFGDAGQLQQVLMNLLANALQAMRLGGKGGTVRVRTKRASSTHAILEVIDDGPGVPSAILSKIFDPFFTTKPEGIGTGLGLSIVLGIVREHGGQVRVASPPGGGATFSVELPAAAGNVTTISGPYSDGTGIQAAEPPEEQGPVRQESERVLSPWAGSWVLVVEDEATVAQLIADVLKDEGLEVDVVLDGREALRRAASEHYDLLICDMKMPGIDGEQFYKRLARGGNPLSEHTLFVTGDVLAAHTREFLDRHGLRHLAKPFRVEELTETVRQALMQISPRKPRGAKTNVARK